MNRKPNIRFRRLRCSSDADIVRLTNARIIIIISLLLLTVVVVIVVIADKESDSAISGVRPRVITITRKLSQRFGRNLQHGRQHTALGQTDNMFSILAGRGRERFPARPSLYLSALGTPTASCGAAKFK